MDKISNKKEKDKLMENYGTEKTEDNNISIDLENKIIKKNSKRKTKKQEEEKYPLNTSLTDNQFTSENKASNSFEKQDMSEDVIMTISSNKKYHTKNKHSNLPSQSFTKHYETMIQYENRRKDKIMRLKKILEKKEMEKLQPIPKISKHSIQLLKNTKSNKADLIKRMKEEEEKTLRKRLELAAKIKEDRMKRKAEQEKKPEFKIKKKPTDKKFNKFYTNMVEKDKMKKAKFAKFTEVVKDYEMRECVFQPNLTDYDENRYKNLNSNKIVHRLYDDELKRRVEKKKELEKKYKPSFKPNLNIGTSELAEKRNKMSKKKTESRNIFGNLDKKFNNSVEKRISRNYKLKDSDKIGQFNATDVKINNKSFDNNIYMEEMKTQKINNSKILKRNKSKDVSDKTTKKKS